jgi:hypothetical protein
VAAATSFLWIRASTASTKFTGNIGAMQSAGPAAPDCRGEPILG